MRKIAIILTILSLSFTASSQTLNPFPTTDSLRKFINKWIRNSAVDAFTNLRLNSSLLGMTRFIDSAYGGQVTGFTYSDDTIRLSLLSGQVLKVALPASAGNTNLGSGFRLLVPSSQGIKTLFAGNTVLIDSTSNTDALTFKVDTTVIATLYDITLKTDVSRFLDSCAALRAAIGSGGGGTPGGSSGQIQYNNAGSFAGDAGLSYNATSNTITTDTTDSKKLVSDSIRQRPNAIGKARIGGGIVAVGNSMLVGTAATTLDSAYITMIADTLQVPVWNMGLGGSGILWSVTKHDSAVDGRNNSSASLVEVGYNDVVLTSNLTIAYKKIASGLKSIFINHFADEYAPASNDPAVIRYGTWTLNQDNRTWGGKTAQGALTTALNDSIVYKFYGPTAAVVLIGGDSTVFNSSIFEAFVDGVSIGQFNTNRITDGVTVSGKVNTRLPYGLVVSGLSNGLHSLKIVNVATRSLMVDYFATLSPNKPSLIIFQIPNPAGGSNGNMGQANARIDSVYQTMPADYPVLLVRTNNFYDPATGLSGDAVHPNNTGMKQITRAFRSVYDSACLHGNGHMIHDGKYWWITDRGYKRLPTWAGVWNKGEAAALFQGYVEIPGNQSFRQAGRNLISGDYAGGWLRIGPDAMQNRTTLTDGVAIGVEAARDGTTSSGYVAIGFRAGRGNITGNSRIDIGANAGREGTGASAINIGSQAGFWNTGTENLFIGNNSGQGASGTSNGLRNVGLGTLTLQSLTSGIRNLAGGWNSGQIITTGGSNILFGYDIQPPAATTSNYMSLGNALFATGVNTVQGSSVSTGSKIGIVNNSPAVTLHIGGTDAVALNGGTTAQRPTGAAGYIRWNTDSTRVEYYTGSKWVTLLPGDISASVSAGNNQIVTGTGGGITSSSAYSVEDDGSGGYTLKVGTATSSNRGNLQLGNTSGSGSNVVDFIGSGLLQATANVSQLAATGFSHNWFLGSLASQRMKLDHGGLRVMTRLKVDTVTTGAADDSLLVIDNGEVKAIPNTQSQWIKVTKAYTDFVAASTSDNIAIYSLPAGSVLHAAIMKHTASFTGGSIASYTLSLGTGTGPTDFIPASNVFQAAAGNVIFSPSTALVPKAYNMGSTTGIFLYATSTGGNVNTATQGSVDIWLLISTLP